MTSYADAQCCRARDLRELCKTSPGTQQQPPRGCDRTSLGTRQQKSPGPGRAFSSTVHLSRLHPPVAHLAKHLQYGLVVKTIAKRRRDARLTRLGQLEEQKQVLLRLELRLPELKGLPQNLMY